MADKLYNYLTKLRDYATIIWSLAKGGTGADLSATGGAGQVLKQKTVGGNVTVEALVAADIPTIAESQVTNLTTDLAAKLVKASNLSDLTDASAARTNLGLGTAATQSSGVFAAASHTHAESDVTGLVADLALKAPLASPTFTGPTADNLTLSSGAANGVIINCTLSSGSSFIVWRRSGTNKFVENLTGTNNDLTWTNSATGRTHSQFKAAGGTILGNSTDALGFFGGAGTTKPTGNVLTALSGVGLITSPTLAESDVTNLTTDLAAKAPIDSPTFTTTAAAPTPTVGDSSTQIATTAFVAAAIAAASPASVGNLEAMLYGIAF